MQECSEEMQEYFDKLESELKRIYEVANEARNVGLDPASFSEIHPAKDLAARVEALTGPAGVADEIRELSKKMDREEVAFRIAEEIVNNKFTQSEKNQTAELATRTALSILTGGITAAPIEGISSVKIRENFDKTEYLAVYFAGPIRSAGGTEQALAVLVADWVRTLLQLDRYKPIQNEIERYVEEIEAYKKAVNLQYVSSPEEIRNAAASTPVEITGEATETVEVSGHRDLKRIDTNKLRGGACLVLNDGIIGKAHKLIKIVKRLNISGWDWLQNLQVKKDSGDTNDPNAEKVPPKDKFIAKVITGRPVFAYPSKVGGFRIRYGRSRNTGFAAVGLNPATMSLLDNFLVPGTQFILERPGKGSIVLPVDSIEGPIVRLKGGQVLQINSISEANKIKDKVEKLLFLGDCLIGFGEFLENNHILIPAGYCEEWWAEELRNALEKKNKEPKDAAGDLTIPVEKLERFLGDPFFQIPDESEALLLSRKLQIPIHPKYNLFWSKVPEENLISLHNWLKNGKFEDNPPSINLNFDPLMKDILEKLGLPHKLQDNEIILVENVNIIKSLFDIDSNDFKYTPPMKGNLWKGSISSYIIRDRAPYYIGGRMGRPEKAKGREFFHILFPVGIKGGNRRSLIKAAESQKISVELVHRECPSCKMTTFLNKCDKCKIRTILVQKCSQPSCGTRTEDEFCPRCGNVARGYDLREIPIKKLLSTTLKKLNETVPKEIKGVKGLMSKNKTPEILEKGILRAKHNLFAYRDGTIRFDATDAPLTHFKPSEIGVSIAQLHNLGYHHDYLGNPLTSEDQILEMREQDIIIPKVGAEFLIKVACFIDELLVKVYHLESFYKVAKKEDLLGHLVVGLAPHISAGVVGRIVGFTSAKLCYAHPYWHSAKRRNCFPASSTVTVEINGLINRISVKELFEKNFENERIENRIAIRSTPRSTINALSFDIASNSVKMTPVVDVLKLPATDHLVTIHLKLGRSFTTTYDHPVIVCENGCLKEKRAFEVKKHDRMLLPRIDVPESDVECIDLVKEFSKPRYAFLQDDLAIRSIKDFTEELIHRKGLQDTAESLGISKKTLCNCYSGQDSIPLSILLRLLAIHSLTLDDIPECKLGFKRGDTLVNRYIPINNSFMRLSGYFLSEGFYREAKDTYQVDLAVSKEDLREDMMACIRDVFGDGFNPYINENRITIANRTILHVFRDVIGFMPTARTKRVPVFMFKLPLAKIRNLVAAYFSGDGGVDPVRRTVVCTSVHRELLVDMDFLLLRFGIFSAIDSQDRGDYIEHKLRIRGENVPMYEKEIGFTSVRKAAGLRECVLGLDGIMKEQEMIGENRLVPVNDVEIHPSNDVTEVYSLHAKDYHTVLINDHIVTHQCDGDEDTVILALDAVLNFSRSYLPKQKGGMMDAPLVLTSQLNPSEVDDEVYNMEVGRKFPLEFYEKSLEYTHPKSIEGIMDIVNHRLGCKSQFEGLFFTHPTSDISKGPKISRYKELKTVREKVSAQLDLAAKTEASDVRDEARRLLHTHFIPDVIGNLRSFATQQFRCMKCNAKYRRLPLVNQCIKCGGHLVLTVTEGGITKYLGLALDIVKKYDLDMYTKQRLLLAQDYVESIFTSDKGRQLKLDNIKS